MSALLSVSRPPAAAGRLQRPVAADNDAVYPLGHTLSIYTQYSRSLVKAAHLGEGRRCPAFDCAAVM